MGRQLGSKTVNNIWIPDGYKDIPVDRKRPRELLEKSLDALFSDQLDERFLLDAVESKLFGIGSEAYVAGSHGAGGYWNVAPGTSDSIPLNYTEGYNYAITASTTGDASGYALSPSPSGALAAYVGSGTIPVDLNSSANVLFNGNGNITYSSTVDVAGTLEVSYLYSTVPEPGTWMAAGLLFGVVGLHTGRCLWRRKNQQVTSLKA